MNEWIIGENAYTTSALFNGIRSKGSEESKRLIDLLKHEKAVDAKYSIALAFIDQIKRPYLDKYLRNSKYKDVPLSVCEESFNDGLYSIYSDIDKYDESKSSLNTWIENKFHYAFLTNFRKWLRLHPEENQSLDNEESPISELFTSSNLDISENIAQVDLIVQAFRKLQIQDQELLKLVYSGETPTSIVSKNLIEGANINSIKVAVFRARQRFNNNLIDAGWD